MKKITAMAVAVSLFGTACATTQYVPKQSGMIKIMPKGYQKDDQLFKKGAFNQGLVKATASDEEANLYAKRSSKNAKWSFGLLWGGVATLLGGSFTTDNKKPNSATRNVVGNSLIGTGLAAMLLSIIPAIQQRASKADAINKYNDDVLLKGESK